MRLQFHWPAFREFGPKLRSFYQLQEVQFLPQGHCAEARLVLSRSGKCPHLVLPSKAGFKCDSECANFKSLGICYHTVVVAHLNNQLPEFITHIKKAKKKPNMMQLALHDMPAGTGKKGGRPPRKRARNELVEKRVERFQVTSANQCISTAAVNITVGSGTNVSPIIQQACSSKSVRVSSSDLPGSYCPHPCPEQYAPFPPYPPSFFPIPPMCSPHSAYGSPAVMTGHPFTVVFISGNISVCAGCSNHYPKPATPPYDLCIKHTEWRQFKVDGTPKSKFAPAYYHVSLPCLQVNWPSFSALNLIIHPDVSQKLTETHIPFLRAFGCLI